MCTNNKKLIITDSTSYQYITSLFEDIDSMENIVEQRISENNIPAALRYISILRFFTKELRTAVVG